LKDGTDEALPTKNLWWALSSIFCMFATMFGALLGCNFKYKQPNLRPEVDLPPFTAVRPLATGDLVVVRLGVIALSVFITWALMAAESALLFLAGDVQTAPIPALAQAPYSVGTGTCMVLLGVGYLLWLWKQTAETLWFGLSGRAWVVLSGLGLHCILSFALMIGVADHLDDILAALQDPPSWLVALVGGGVLLKLVAAAWAIRAIWRSRLLATRRLLALLGLWLLACGGLFALLTGVLPAELISWPWLACGTVLVLPLARITCAPLALAWNRHR
jgi:hypothetical protein